MNPSEFSGSAPSGADIIVAHGHCSGHRDEILRSDLCGCFYCLATFPPTEVRDWVDWPFDQPGAPGRTALCPRCSIDAVIGSEAGYPLTPDFLGRMHSHLF